MELTLPEYDLVQYDPSEIAAAAIYLSIALLDGESTWCPKMTHYSMYSEEHLAPIVKKLAQILLRNDPQSLKYTVSTCMNWPLFQFLYIFTFIKDWNSLLADTAKHSPLPRGIQVHAEGDIITAFGREYFNLHH